MPDQITLLAIKISNLAVHLDFFTTEFTTYPKMVRKPDEEWLYLDWLWFLLEIDWSGLYD
jgi:hypothetical protein